MTATPGPGPRAFHATTIAVVVVAVMSVVTLAYLMVTLPRIAQDAADDLRAQSAAIHRQVTDIERAQRRQAAIQRAEGRILCDAATGNLVVVKAIRNVALQQGLDVSGIPGHLPPEVERICARYS